MYAESESMTRHLLVNNVLESINPGFFFQITGYNRTVKPRELDAIRTDTGRYLVI